MSDVRKTAYDPIENALFKVRFPDSGDATIDGEDEFVREGARTDKAVFLAALEENGMTVVPKEPSAEMVRAAVPPLEGREPIRNIYQAMLLAQKSATARLPWR